LLARCSREGVDVVVPTVDTELLPLARMRTQFEAQLVLASEATLAVCLDKWELAQRCAGRVRVPWTVVVDGAFDPDAVELPAIVKPRSGSAVTGRTLHDDGLDAFAREVAAAIELTTVANVQVKEDADGAPALLEVNPR